VTFAAVHERAIRGQFAGDERHMVGTEKRREQLKSDDHVTLARQVMHR
jgi:hypothetical protein